MVVARSARHFRRSSSMERSVWEKMVLEETAMEIQSSVLEGGERNRGSYLNCINIGA